jgi:ubiquinone/menaquinone biosynthesis C-methylase UbiE
MIARRRETAFKGLPMEGIVARWYAGLRRSEGQIKERRQQASRLTEVLPDGGRLLEVAPGPGYFAIEVARSGRFHVTGLDISRSFVEIARENARRAGVDVDFRLGDAAHLPFPDRSFDLIVCQAAFKNFARPQRAIDEMHRVLRDGGMAVIQDLRRDAPDAAVDEEVRGMGLGPVSALLTRWILRGLRRLAYTAAQFERFAAASPFGVGEIVTEGIGVEVRLRRG